MKTVGSGTRGTNRFWIASVLLFFAEAAAADNTSCPTGADHERWAVKTSASGQQPVTVTLAQLKNIEVPSKSAAHAAKNSPGLLQGEFKTDGLSLKEGQIVRTKGWLHLVNHDSGDSDYHLQLTESPSGCTGGCVIVEIPRDTYPKAGRHLCEACAPQKLCTLPIDTSGDDSVQGMRSCRGC
jgi:hypothetical protein